MREKHTVTIVASIILAVVICLAVVMAWTQQKFNNELTEKAATYEIYIDGVKIEDNSKLNLKAYPKDKIQIDDDTKCILIATVM